MSSIEKRGLEGTASLEGRTASGYALKFGIQSRDLGGYVEVIKKGALDDTDMSDVIALFNHNEDVVLARSIAETLVLTVDDIGLHYEFDIPETTAGNDLIIMMKRGDVKHSSFAFVVGEVEITRIDEVLIRNIITIKRIQDVSIVSIPAYYDTYVEVRSLTEKETSDMEGLVNNEGLYPFDLDYQLVINKYRN